MKPLYAVDTFEFVPWLTSMKPGTAAPAEYMTGQIYVEKLVPPKVTQKHPLVFIHGSAQTGTVCRKLPRLVPID
jgi:hypothetical protein